MGTYRSLWASCSSVDTVDPWSEHLQSVRAHDLVQLRYHWGDAYEITWEAGTWRAVRRDDRQGLTADSSGQLNDRIIDDYSARPVPREAGP